MKVMPSRSPSRRNTPPPRIAHRSPGGGGGGFRNRGRSPDRRRRMDAPPGPGGRGLSPPRSRDRRDFRHSPRSQPPDFPVPRRSRSPLRESKRRSFSPGPGKRKMSPKRERGRDPERSSRGAMGRKRSRSKSPARPVGPIRDADPRMGPYGGGPPEVSPPPGRGYQAPSDPYPPVGPVLDVEHSGRSLGSLGERFRGPGGSSYEEDRAERPVFRGPDGTGYDIDELKKITVDIRRNLPERKAPSVVRNIINPEDVVLVRRPGGQRFESPGRYGGAPSHSREYYPSGGDREPSGTSRDYGRPTRDYERHGTSSGFESRDKPRDDRFERRGGDDLRHDLELRRRDDTRYSAHGESVRTYEKGRDYRGESDRGSGDLRMRINEKRTDRHDEREPGHHRMMERGEGMERERERDRDRRGMIQPSPPGSERRRAPGPIENFGRSGGGDPERPKMRGDGGRMPPPPHGPSGRREDGPDRFHQDPHPPEFVNQRPDRFHGAKPWDVNPEYVPKGRAYFEHDNRDDEMMRMRGRGMPGPRGAHMRGRGMMRGRPFRGGGPVRGFGRGTHRGGYSPRKSSADLSTQDYNPGGRR